MSNEKLSHWLPSEQDLVEDGQVDVGRLVDEGVPLGHRRSFLNVKKLVSLVTLAYRHLDDIVLIKCLSLAMF